MPGDLTASSRDAARDKATAAAYQVAQRARADGYSLEYVISCAVTAAEPVIYAAGMKDERERIIQLAVHVEADGEAECYECGNSRLRHLVDVLEGGTGEH